MRNSNTSLLGWRTRLVCAAVLSVALLAVNASAQTFRGTILGTVTDSSGAAIVGAKVTAHNVYTG